MSSASKQEEYHDHAEHGHERQHHPRVRGVCAERLEEGWRGEGWRGWCGRARGGGRGRVLDESVHTVHVGVIDTGHKEAGRERGDVDGLHSLDDL